MGGPQGGLTPTATLVKLQLLKSLKEEHKTSRIVYFCTQKNEPPHDKTKKMTVRQAKTRSLGIRLVWSVFAVHSLGS